jgi:excisionase family DNA binding protein
MDVIYQISKDDLRDIFLEFISEKEPKQTVHLPEKFNLLEAKNYLQQKGVELPESSIYKLTAENRMPVLRFGRKLVFDRKALDNWVNELLSSEKNKSLIP